MLNDPIVLSQATIQNVCFGCCIIPPLPLKISNSSFALLATIGRLECASMTSVKIRPQLRQASIQKCIIFRRLNRNQVVSLFWLSFQSNYSHLCSPYPYYRQ